MYDNILIPTDGSESMAPVIDHAIELATVHGASVHALYVANTASLSDLPMESSWENVSDALRKQGKAAVEAVEQRAGEVPVESAVLDGSPSGEIIEYSEENDIDVIVMGTHGRSGVDRLLLGSVAERVLRSASVPVLTVSLD